MFRRRFIYVKRKKLEILVFPLPMKEFILWNWWRMFLWIEMNPFMIILRLGGEPQFAPHFIMLVFAWSYHGFPVPRQLDLSRLFPALITVLIFFSLKLKPLLRKSQNSEIFGLLKF